MSTGIFILGLMVTFLASVVFYMYNEYRDAMVKLHQGVNLIKEAQGDINELIRDNNEKMTRAVAIMEKFNRDDDEVAAMIEELKEGKVAN